MSFLILNIQHKFLDIYLQLSALATLNKYLTTSYAVEENLFKVYGKKRKKSVALTL